MNTLGSSKVHEKEVYSLWVILDHPVGSLKTIVLSFGHMSHFYNVKIAPFEAEKLKQS